MTLTVGRQILTMDKLLEDAEVNFRMIWDMVRYQNMKEVGATLGMSSCNSFDPQDNRRVKEACPSEVIRDAVLYTAIAQILVSRTRVAMAGYQRGCDHLFSPCGNVSVMALPIPGTGSSTLGFGVWTTSRGIRYGTGVLADGFQGMGHHPQQGKVRSQR